MPTIDSIQPSTPDREYSTLVTHIGDTFSEDRVFYSATRDLGFPVLITPERAKVPSVVRTDSPSMKTKLTSLWSEFINSNLGRLMQPVSMGRPGDLEAILNGAEPMKTLGIRQPIRHIVPVTELFLQEAFVRAYEINTEKIKTEEAMPPSMFLSSNIFLEMRQTAQTNARPLYEELTRDGITPITQEHMIEVTRPLVEMIIAKNPSFSPSSLK